MKHEHVTELVRHRIEQAQGVLAGSPGIAMQYSNCGRLTGDGLAGRSRK